MAKENVGIKSQYLMLARQAFYGYNYLTFKSYIKFSKGQEEVFMDTIIEFKDYCKQHGGNADARAEDELKYIMENSEIDWNKIWEETDIEDYCGPLEAFIEKILCFIDWKTFQAKVNKSDNYVLVKRLYHLYCWQKGIEESTKNKAYEAYLDVTLKRTGKTPEGELREIIDNFMEIFERGYGVDTVESYLQRCKIEIFAILMAKANLNTLVDYREKKVTLKNLLFFRILKWGQISEWIRDDEKKPSLNVDHGKQLRVLFNNCDDFIFKGKPLDDVFDDYDRATLTYMMKDIEEALEIFNRKEYPIYDQKQLDSLLETGIYQTNNSPFVDRFATMLKFICIDNPEAVMNNRINRLKFMEFIYSSKVRVISYATLMILKNYLSEEEFNDYLTHINDEGIQIYFGDYLGLRSSNDDNQFSNIKPIIMTLGYANDSDLNFIDKAKLRAIIEELGNHKSGMRYLKESLFKY